MKENPAEAETISHKLLLRAGMIRRIAGGIYTYLPLGWRVICKIEEIIRQEMNSAGGVELNLPIIQPAELWQQSGRWDVYGEEMFRLKDRHQRDFCLGPTHEEIITFLVKNEVNSYRDLPLLLYQIQNKYRDEKRPRFGLLRAREFIMKDLYSFDANEEGLQNSYEAMYKAYERIFKRMGLNFKIVEADPGAIGGNTSHEFVSFAEEGEAEIVHCFSCSYAADVEKATTVLKKKNTSEDELPLELIKTPDKKTIKEVANFIGVELEKLIKTLVFEADGRIIVVLVKGDRELNIVKLKNYLKCNELELAGDEKIYEIFQCEKGYLGPVGLKGVPVLADREVMVEQNLICGANRNDYHYINVNPERDFIVDDIVDLIKVEALDPCPVCGEPLYKTNGIEVGQIFQLGTKYSEALNAFYQDERGQLKPFIMGCYGIGISRSMAAVVEQLHDDKGIIWPISIAPYPVVIVPTLVDSSLQWETALKLESEINELGLEVMIDDRKESAGVKFADADLIGYPLRLTVGKKTEKQRTVDIKIRRGEEKTVAIEEAAKTVKQIAEDLSKPLSLA